MFMRRLFTIFSFLVTVLPELASAGGSELPSHPLKFYSVIAMGQQKVRAATESTVMSVNRFIPYDQKDLMERAAFGYAVLPVLNLEAGAIFFSGYGYRLPPLANTINRSLFAFDLLAKIVLSSNRLHFYFMGGPVLVHSSVGNFHLDANQFTTETVFEIEGHWPNATYVRPEVGGGISIDVTQQIRLGAMYATIFGTGEFNSVIQTVDDAPLLTICGNYLPRIDYLAVTVDFIF